MNLIAEIRKFLKEEPLYGYLLVALLLIYALAFAFSGGVDETASPALERIKAAEKVMQEKKSESAFMEEVLRNNKTAAVVLIAFVALFVLCLGIGLVLDTLFLMNHFQKKVTIPTLRMAGVVDWGPRDVVKVTILFFVFGFASGIALGLMKKVLFPESEGNFLMLLHTTITDLAVLFLIFHVVIKRYARGIHELGLYFKAWRKDVVLGVLSYMATLPVFMVILLVLLGIAALFSYEPPPHPLVEVFVEEDRRNPLIIGYSLFLACVIGPIIEEVFFRGFCYPALKKVWGVRIAAMVSAGLFALIHHSTFAFWPIFVLGLILAYLYEKRGSLIPPITMHVIHNSIFIGYFFVVKRIFLDKLV